MRRSEGVSNEKGAGDCVPEHRKIETIGRCFARFARDVYGLQDDVFGMPRHIVARFADQV